MFIFFFQSRSLAEPIVTSRGTPVEKPCLTQNGRMFMLLAFVAWIKNSVTSILYLLIYLSIICLLLLLYLILLACVYSVGELETSLPSWLTIISRSARQPDVFLLLMFFCKETDNFNKKQNYSVWYPSTLLILTLVRFCLIFSLITISISISNCGSSSSTWRFFNIFLIHILYVIFVVLCL
jgi:hypothetical protein